MALSWNEIKERAVAFSKEWENTIHENADAKPFLVDFFNVFGISQRKVSTFEEKVKKLDERDGYIDLFWKGTLLVEMKSKGKNLDKAHQQAVDYLQTVKQIELPKYIMVSDFENFRLYDLEERRHSDFKLKDFVKNVQLFGFIAGYIKKTFKEQDPVNIEAAELMGKLHDKLEAVGYDGHVLEVYLVRLLFCLFGDDTTIFEKDTFKDFIEQKTSEDGSDLAARLNELFFVLNTPKEKRLKNLDEQLNAFPYVNGKLFEETLPMASFSSEMRRNLLECCSLNWGKISPAIFGSMFQSVMNPKERRNLGAHYTSEKNILKLIKPLFLDELYEEFEAVKGNKNKLSEFHKKLSTLKFLDPACGCGNFLVITYRELRLLEIKILRSLYKSGQGVLDIRDIIWLDVDMMYGIEIEEFPARIAEVAMWLIDHQMNMIISEEFGQYFIRLPLKKSAKIVNANALQIDWKLVVNPSQLSYILGNPPFIGKALQNLSQKKDLELVFGNMASGGLLDFVAAWYIKAASFIINTKIKAAFVSTNSIAQGEQVGILWSELFNTYKCKIFFAHRTFNWSNEARGNAAVHVVIIGFSNFDIPNKLLFEYDGNNSEPLVRKVKNINPYLVEASDIVLSKRRKPICNVPEISFGSMPNDGGHLILTDEEKRELIKSDPDSKKFIRPLISAREFLNGEKRWCLWLTEIKPFELKNHKEIEKRVGLVKELRNNSPREATKKLAAFPTLFGENRQPNSDYVLIPRHSSENRKYIPLGFFTKNEIASDSCCFIPNANLFHFGILTSEMHMTWVKYTCGRIKSDFRYSNETVYNNYPWPENPTSKQIADIERTVQEILDIRKDFAKSSLADLYDPLSMPPQLSKAHQKLDKLVDQCYKSAPFTSDAKRMEFLFELFEKYTGGLFGGENKKKGKSNG